MQEAFVERWHKETSSFHLPIWEMTITLDDVAFLLHLLIRGRLHNYSLVDHSHAIEWMIDYLESEPKEAFKQCSSTNGANAKLSFLKNLYHYHVSTTADSESEGDDFFVLYHCHCALRCYFIYLVGTSIFMDKSANYVDVTYLQYFMDLDTLTE